MDTEGGLHYSGSIDRYYTEEEKERKNEYARKREKEQRELFEIFEGLWVCEDGDYIRVYENESYTLEYWVNSEFGRESSVYFQDHLYAQENNRGVFYNDGLWEQGFAVVFAEDGSSFECLNKIFVHQ